MTTNHASELARFQQFIAQRIENGEALSPEEALDLWRLKNPSQDDFADSVVAVRQALADLDAGDQGMAIEEFDREFRRRHGLPPIE